MIEIDECVECHKPTVVARIIGNDVVYSQELTGMYLEAWTGYEWDIVGVICADCAFHGQDAGKYGLCFGGGNIQDLAQWSAMIIDTTWNVL